MYSLKTFSSAEASLCGMEAGGDGERKERKRVIFPLPIATRALSIFRSLLFLLGYPTGASAGGESLGNDREKNCLHHGSMVTILVAVRNIGFNHLHTFFFTKTAQDMYT